MADVKHLLSVVPKYFKANLHTHTCLTDGKPTPEECKALYKKNGYSILCISDHNIAMAFPELNDPDFLMLTGAEYNINQYPFDRPFEKTMHLNFIAKRPDLLWQPFRHHTYKEEALPYLEKAEISDLPRVHTTEAINRIIAEANRRGFLVMFNHPHWSLEDYTDYCGLKGLWAMEMMNYGSSSYGDGDNFTVWRDLLNLGNQVFPVGADDSHSEKSACGAWIMVGAEKLEYGSVIEALERGDFYASNGPEIHEVSLEGTVLTVRCSDAQSVVIRSGNRFSASVKPVTRDGLLREATFDLQKWLEPTEGHDGAWFSVRVIGPYGHFAQTRAFMRNEF